MFLAQATLLSKTNTKNWDIGDIEDGMSVYVAKARIRGRRAWFYHLPISSYIYCRKGNNKASFLNFELFSSF